MKKIHLHPNLLSSTGNSFSLKDADSVYGFGSHCPECGKIHLRSRFWFLVSLITRDISFAYYSPSLKNCIKLVQEESIIIHHSYMYRNIPKEKKFTLLLEVMESLIFPDLAKNSFKYFMLSLFGNVFLKSDANASQKACETIVYSELEASALEKRGVPVRHQEFVPSTTHKPLLEIDVNKLRKIGLYGNFDWPPNRVMFDEIVSRKKLLEDYEFVLTSRASRNKDLLSKLCDAGLVYRIVPDCGEDEFLDFVDAVWCVTSIGGGVRTKLINALHHGVPVFVNETSVADNLKQVMSYRLGLIYVDSSW